jgi:hypothetical protein
MEPLQLRPTETDRLNRTQIIRRTDCLKRGTFRERKISRFRDFFHNSRNLKTLKVSIREILFSRNPLNSSIREIKLSRNRFLLVIFPDFRNWLHEKL